MSCDICWNQQELVFSINISVSVKTFTVNSFSCSLPQTFDSRQFLYSLRTERQKQKMSQLLLSLCHLVQMYLMLLNRQNHFKMNENHQCFGETRGFVFNDEMKMKDVYLCCNQRSCRNLTFPVLVSLILHQNAKHSSSKMNQNKCIIFKRLTVSVTVTVLCPLYTKDEKYLCLSTQLYDLKCLKCGYNHARGQCTSTKNLFKTTVYI